MFYSKQWVVIILLTISALAQAQNITNKLGGGGDFLLKDNSSNDIIKVDEDGGMLLSDKSHVDFSLSPGLEIFRTGANATLKLTTYSFLGNYGSSVDMYTCGGTYFIPSSIGSYHSFGSLNVYGYHNSQYQLGGLIKFYSDDLSGTSDLHTNMQIQLMGSSGYVSPITLFYDNSVSMPSIATGSGNQPVYATSGGTLTLNSSDVRLKKDIKNYKEGISVIKNITPIEFHWKSETKYDTLCNNVGFIAQNIQGLIPEAVGHNPEGYLTLDMVPITATLVNATKELIEKVGLLEKENSTLKQQVNELLKLKEEVISINKMLLNNEITFTKK